MLSPPALARYLRREKPAVMISALDRANIAALCAKGLSGTAVRTVVTIHNTLSVTKRQASMTRIKILPQLMRYSFPWADEIVAVSNEAADDFSAVTGVERNKITTVYNPVVSDDLFQRASGPVDHPWFAPDQPPVVLAVGRLTAQKDFSTLIRAFELLHRKQPARLVILGEGKERPALEALVKQCGLESSVLMPGFVDNPYAYLKRASAFVLSSRWEGLPTVLIEALALGVPVVSTDCKSGPEEILAGGKYGELVAVGDHDALAKALGRTLEGAAKVVPREAWQRFTLEASVAAYMRVAGVHASA
jgi:glycosyltransferase involved in cell wall biosynthesis